MLVHLRHEVAEHKRGHIGLQSTAMAVAGWVLSDRKHFELAERAAGMAARMLPNTTHLGPLPWPASAWTRARDLPMPAQESFREWWRKNKGEAGQ
jgi:L-lactate dehydrogenase complex protein LldF